MRSTMAAIPATAATTPTLFARRLGIDTYRENVVYLRRDCPTYRAEGFQALSKVRVTANGNAILAVLNVVDDGQFLADCELGLSEQAFAQLGAAEGAPVRVEHAEPPPSLAALRRKVDGEALSREDLRAIVRDIAQRRYSAIELAAFLVASQRAHLDPHEVLYLTEAMIAVGSRLDWKSAGPGPVVDKHCIGGIPGNRTSMIVVPIVAAYAQAAGSRLLMPKTSSRAITSPAGTADTMECLAEVELPLERMQQIVRTQRACLAWGGRARLSPADDVLISVSRPLSLDSPAQMVASILSKKVAAGSTHLVLDIPLGPTAKVRRPLDAQRLRQLFAFVAAALGLTLDVVVTDGTQPVGRGIGPVLEARDVLQVLARDPAAPADLREKAVQLAARVLAFDPAVGAGNGLALARDQLESGRAEVAMQALIEAQGRHAFDPRHLELAPQAVTLKAEGSGLVTAIDNLRLARVARLAGAPQCPGAGVDLLRKVGDPVRQGEPLYRIHAETAAELAFARRMADAGSGYTIGTGVPPVDPEAQF
jgi:thymidine phosphorylase